MEKETSKVQFDFNKKNERKVEEQTPIFNEKTLKNIKIASFLLLGGLAIGTGIGLTNGFVQGYKVSEESKGHIAEIQAQTEAVIKTKKSEIEANFKLKQAEEKAKEDKIKNAQSEQLAIENDKEVYKVWISNRADIINNYELQLPIYDKLYQNAVQSVKTGVLSLTDLDEIREAYQSYKGNIHQYIQFIKENTNSFETFHDLNEESREYLKNELIGYQNGNLHRSTDLGNLLVDKFNEDDDDDEKVAAIRKNIRNQMIDGLADLVNTKNETTKTKKLKN